MTDALVGLSVADAEAWASANGYIIRVTEIDGEGLPVTEDYVTTRINVSTVDDVLTEVTSFG